MISFHPPTNDFDLVWKRNQSHCFVLTTFLLILEETSNTITSDQPIQKQKHKHKNQEYYKQGNQPPHPPPPPHTHTHIYIYYKTCFMLSIKVQLLIKGKVVKSEYFLDLKLTDAVFILLIHVKMPTIVGILTFMSRINFMH